MPRFGGRDGIEAEATPRVTAAKPTKRERAAPKCTVGLNGLGRVIRAAGNESTGGRGADEQETQRDPDPAVGADQPQQDVLRGTHADAGTVVDAESGDEPGLGSDWSNPTRLSAARKSLSTASAERGAMEGRATKTRSTAVVRRC